MTIPESAPTGTSSRNSWRPGLRSPTTCPGRAGTPSSSCAGRYGACREHDEQIGAMQGLFPRRLTERRTLFSRPKPSQLLALLGRQPVALARVRGRLPAPPSGAPRSRSGRARDRSPAATARPECDRLSQDTGHLRAECAAAERTLLDASHVT